MNCCMTEIRKSTTNAVCISVNYVSETLYIYKSSVTSTNCVERYLNLEDNAYIAICNYKEWTVSEFEYHYMWFAWETFVKRELVRSEEHSRKLSAAKWCWSKLWSDWQILAIFKVLFDEWILLQDNEYSTVLKMLFVSCCCTYYVLHASLLWEVFSIHEQRARWT